MVRLLQEYGAEQAQRRGDAVALGMGDDRLTYGELDAAANRLARMLEQVGCGRGDRVCLLASKSPAAIVGMLATLKTGAAYVPIDISGPATRTARIVRSAAPAAVLAAHEAAGLLDELRARGALAAHRPVGALDAELAAAAAAPIAFGPDDTRAQDAAPPATLGRADDPAHILFTSGSTGEPKGVVIAHRNVTAFIEWATRYFGTKASDRISGHPPLHFDLSTFDIFGSLCAGAELHLVPPSMLLPQQVAALISERELTQWFSVPSMFTYMAKFDVVPDGGFPSLERVLWCGEVLPTPVLVHWMRRLPHARFTNLYGPTETTIASSYYTLPDVPQDETEPIPIGSACAAEELLVLDEQRRPVPHGEAGDLYIAGAGLSPGYWRDEERSRAAFVDDPRVGAGAGAGAGRIYRTGDLARVGDDGLVRFLGRTDSQVKCRGHRIELGEIEVALGALPQLMEYAVVAIDSRGFEGVTICCAYSAVTGADIAPAGIRAALSASLPRYMLPSRWKPLAALPKNVNGKIDRQHLREMFAEEVVCPA